MSLLRSFMAVSTANVFLTLVGVTVPVQGWTADASTATVRLLASSCTTCHGPTPASGLSSLSRLPATELLERLRAFRQGQRPGTLMPQLLSAYSDSDLQALAAYLGQQP
jgi:cytochrome c553